MQLQLFHGCARRLQKCVNIMQFIYTHVRGVSSANTHRQRKHECNGSGSGRETNELYAILEHLTEPQAIHIHMKSAIQNARSHCPTGWAVRLSVCACLPYVLSPSPLPPSTKSFGRVPDCPLGALVCPLTVRCRLQEPVDVAAWHAL